MLVRTYRCGEKNGGKAYRGGRTNSFFGSGINVLSCLFEIGSPGEFLVKIWDGETDATAVVSDAIDEV